jgi:hypothetical protein
VIEATESEAAAFPAKLKADWDKVQVWKKEKPDKVDMLLKLLDLFYVYGVGKCAVTVVGKDDHGKDKKEGEWSEDFVQDLAKGIGNVLKLNVPFTKIVEKLTPSATAQKPITPSTPTDPQAETQAVSSKPPGPQAQEPIAATHGAQDPITSRPKSPKRSGACGAKSCSVM